MRGRWAPRLCSFWNMVLIHLYLYLWTSLDFVRPMILIRFFTSHLLTSLLPVWCIMHVLVQSELDHLGDSDDQVHVLSRTAPIGYVLQQHTTAAYSAPNELVNSRQAMSSPLSLGDAASTATSISEVTPTVQSSYSHHHLSFSFSCRAAHVPFACQRWGLPHRLAQCTTPGMELVWCSATPSGMPNGVYIV